VPILPIVSDWVLTGISREIEDAAISIVTIKTARSMKNQAEPEM